MEGVVYPPVCPYPELVATLAFCRVSNQEGSRVLLHGGHAGASCHHVDLHSQEVHQSRYLSFCFQRFPRGCFDALPDVSEGSVEKGWLT